MQYGRPLRRPMSTHMNSGNRVSQLVQQNKLLVGKASGFLRFNVESQNMLGSSTGDGGKKQSLQKLSQQRRLEEQNKSQALAFFDIGCAKLHLSPSLPL